MVSGVQNSLGSTAYLKSSQLGSGNGGNSANFRKEVEEKSTPANDVNTARSAETQRSSDTRESLTRKPETTQLETRNDDTTIKAETQRGSLLDIAV